MGKSRIVATVLALCLLTAVAVGCGGDGDGSASTQASTSTESSTTAPESAGVGPDTTEDPEDPASSPVPEGRSAQDEGVPLPPGAKPSQGAAYDYVNAWLIPELDFDSVVAFYDDEMPVGQDWKDWAWCETGAAEDANPTRTYTRGGAETLSVTIVERKPPTVLMGIADASAC